VRAFTSPGLWDSGGSSLLVIWFLHACLSACLRAGAFEEVMLLIVELAIEKREVSRARALLEYTNVILIV
jgi:hypothetical protein